MELKVDSGFGTIKTLNLDLMSLDEKLDELFFLNRDINNSQIDENFLIRRFIEGIDQEIMDEAKEALKEMYIECLKKLERLKINDLLEKKKILLESIKDDFK